MTAEEAIKEYPVWVRRKKVLEMQIRSFNGLSETEFIESLNFSHPQEEKVQTSGVSDKTAKIAMIYKDIVSKENKELCKNLISEYNKLCCEINFFESVLETLSGYLPMLIKDMVINNFTWGALSEKYNIGQTMIAKYRKKAIIELNLIYADKNLHDNRMKNS